MENKKRLAKAYLADKGIKVFQKDMDAVDRFYSTAVRRNTGHGTYDIFNHREIYVVFMKDGTQYEILRETVDRDGNFSTNSAKFITRSVRTIPAE